MKLVLQGGRKVDPDPESSSGSGGLEGVGKVRGLSITHKSIILDMRALQAKYIFEIAGFIAEFPAIVKFFIISGLCMIISAGQSPAGGGTGHPEEISGRHQRYCWRRTLSGAPSCRTPSDLSFSQRPLSIMISTVTCSVSPVCRQGRKQRVTRWLMSSQLFAPA